MSTTTPFPAMAPTINSGITTDQENNLPPGNGVGRAPMNR